ncbi:MAG TPA: hypothetical protein PLJ38_09300, partial [bacterium]|nr:hypothetical protein [bacterium]
TFAEFDKFYEARKKILIKYQSFFDKFQEIKKLHLQYLATFENQYSEWVKVIELNGCKNLVIKDSNGREFLLHSKYNPILESQRQIAKFATDDNTLIILIGAGLGYKVQSLIETKDFYKIIVIEPDKYIFNAAQAIVYKKITNTDILYFVDLNLVDLIFELNAVFLTLPISVKKIKYSIFEPLKKNYENYLLRLEKYLISKFNAEKL